MHKIMKDDMKSNFFVDMGRGKETKHFSPVAVCCLRFICSVKEKAIFFSCSTKYSLLYKHRRGIKLLVFFFSFGSKLFRFIHV